MNRFFLGNDISAPPHLGNYAIPNLTSKKIAVDIGSCAGGFLKALKASNINFDEIFCFEASYENFLIVNNVVKTLNVDNVAVFNLAVGRSDGKLVKLKQYKNGGVGNNSLLTHDDWKDCKYQKVMTISFDGLFKLIDTDRINYMKIDCEGSEYDFLMHNNLSKVDSIGIEIHNQLGKEKIDKLINYIKKYHNIINMIDAVEDIRHCEMTTILKK